MSAGAPTDPVEAAKEAAHRRIRDDRRRASADVAPLLDRIARDLYEPDFELTTTPETLWRFRLELGLDPEAYRVERLLETAYRLLTKSDVRVSAVAAGLGFKDPEVFSKWFKSRTGQAPEKLRAATRRSVTASDVGWASAHHPDSAALPRSGGLTPTLQVLRRALVGAVGPEDAKAVIRSLEAEYPDAKRNPA